MKKIALAICALVCFGSAHATLIDRGINTFDSDTGLEWLDLTETFRRSYNDVAADAGLSAMGYRHANANEVDLLFAAANITSSSPSAEDAANFIALLGQTSDNFPSTDIFSLSVGIHDRTPFDPNLIAYSSVGLSGDPNSPIGSSTFNNLNVDPFNTKDYVPFFAGHFLVRSVPEPGTLGLLAAGLLGLGFMRRKQAT